MTAAPELSVVVPTHDRRDSVLRLLGSLRDGTLSAARFEVIVIADGCTDGTVEAIAALQMPFHLETLELTPAGGAARARNRGAAAARAPLLLFLDDDIEPHPSTLAAHLHAHSCDADPDAGATVLVGAPAPVYAGNDFHHRAIWGWWEQQFERLETPGHRVRYDDVYSGILSISARFFSEVGGFEPALPSSCRDDSELGLRLLHRGANVVFSREAGGLHHETRNRSRLIERKAAEGTADAMLARLHPTLWPSLRLSQSEGSLASGLGLLQRTAFVAPAMGRLAATAASWLLDALERMRLRRMWGRLNGAMMYYWYWHGVAAAMAHPTELRTLRERARAAARERGERESTIDLRDGIDEAIAFVDRERPDSLHVRYGAHVVGRVPAVAGAERLRGQHLRRLLGSTLRERLLATLALAELETRGSRHG